VILNAKRNFVPFSSACSSIDPRASAVAAGAAGDRERAVARVEERAGDDELAAARKVVQVHS
jgi:hypothetical protein